MPDSPLPKDELHKIVDDGLCLGCGLCAAIAPHAITIERGDDGDLRAFAADDLSTDDMAKVSQICPSLRLTGLPQDDVDNAPYHDVIWGPYHGMNLSFASQPDIRHEASTAGILTMLAITLLETGKVDAILHVKAADNPANFGIATISRNRGDVMAASGSRYGPTAALLPIEQILKSNKIFAVIAKPCDLNALRNLAALDDRVSQRFAYWLTMLCGGFQPDEAFRQFLAVHDLSEDGLSEVRYRGFGCPGPTSLSYQDGSKTDFHYLDFWGEDESQWSMPLRCKICPDGIGEAADIVAGDAWDGASPDRVESKTDPGFNSVILRTQKGVDLFQLAVDDGVITKTEDVDCDYMSAVQPHQVVKKLAGPARIAGLKEAGSVAPQLIDLRSDALTDLLGRQAYLDQKQGSFERAIKRAKS